MNDWIRFNSQYLKAWGCYIVFGLLVRLLFPPIIRIFVKIMPGEPATHYVIGPIWFWVMTAIMSVASFFVFRFVVRTMIETPQKD